MIRIEIDKVIDTGNSVTAFAHTNFGYIGTITNELTGESHEGFIIDGRAPYNLCYGFERSPVSMEEIKEKLRTQLEMMSNEEII